MSVLSVKEAHVFFEVASKGPFENITNITAGVLHNLGYKRRGNTKKYRTKQTSKKATAKRIATEKIGFLHRSNMHIM